MTPIKESIINKKTKNKPIWLMRQAGRYLPEFRKIRKLNPNFINLCLNDNLSSKITLQPLQRFKLDAAIIFSDILMIPYGLNQEVKFKKNFGPELGSLNLDKISNINEIGFLKKLDPIYKSIKKIKKNIFEDELLINKMLIILEKFLKIHIKHQIKNGATIIQIFDSWVGLLKEKDLPNYVYAPTLNLVNYVKSLNVPVICFPRGIKNYKNFCEIVKPDAVNIDYDVDPISISKEIQIPVQGGLNPKVLLYDKENLKKEALKYLNIFKDHPYIFNLGHGVVPETDPMKVDYLVKLVKDY